jgi:hypothetical protein
LAGSRATLAAYSPSAVVALRRSSALLAAALGFASVAAFGLYAMLAPLAGASTGLVLSLACYAALMLVARAQLWGRVVALGIESDSIAAYDRRGHTLVRGPIVGCTQWANRLLVVAIRPEGRTRAASLVVAADSLDAETFRSLAVRARNAAHHHL